MKFLVVDDDQRTIDLLTLFLAPHAQVEGVLDGPSAVNAFRKALEVQKPFDAVFMDILLPGMDGHETVTAMREMEKTAGISGLGEFKLVMTTGVSDVKNVTRAFFRGFATCYLVKPFSREQVLAELRNNHILEPEA